MKRLFVLCCLFIVTFSSAQFPKTTDSLRVFLKTKPKDTTYVLALNEYAFLIVQEGKYDEAVKKIAEIQSLSEKLNFRAGFVKAMNMRGVLEYTKQNPEKAMEYFVKNTELIKKYKLPKKYLQTAWANISIIYSQMGDNDNATKYAMMVIDFQEKNKLPLRASPYDQIGDNLKQAKKYDEALKYYNKSLGISASLGKFTEMAVGHNKIGNLYDDQKKYQTAITHYKTGLKLAEDANYLLLQTDLLTNIGRIYKNIGNFAEAEKYLKRSEKIALELDIVTAKKSAYQALGDLYFEEKKYGLSETYYLKSLEMAKEITDPEYLFFSYHALAELMQAKGDYKRAYDYNVAAQTAKDSTYKLETAKNTDALLRKYEAEKRDQQIKSLSTQNKLNNLEIENANRQRWFYILGIAALFVIGTLIFRQSRNRQKTNEKLQLLNAELDQANKTKTRFFSILNHDLRSPVSNLISFLHLQKDSPEMLDAESKTRLESKTISSAENLLESMEDILLWSKGQMENFKPMPKNIAADVIFEDLKKHFSSIENVTIVFENPENVSLFTDENYLKTILRNLTSNAIKALEKTPDATVVLKASAQKITVSDNGPGGTIEQFRALYDEKEVIGIKTGLGLHLIRDLAKAINCEISVDAKSGKGTIFTISFQ